MIPLDATWHSVRAEDAMQPAIFLDRDGTLMEEVHYCKNPADVRLIAGAKDAMQRLKTAGFRMVIITNQSGIARGILSTADYQSVAARLMELLGDGLVDATYMCPDSPETPSDFRKPSPGMILRAAKELKLDLPASWTIGDKTSDVLAGIRAGTRSILLRTGHGARENSQSAHFIAADLASAADFILRESGAS